MNTQYYIYFSLRVIPASTALLVRKNYKLISCPDYNDYKVPFDLENDPCEMNNILINAPGVHDLAAELRVGHKTFKLAALELMNLSTIFLLTSLVHRSKTNLKCLFARSSPCA